MKLYQVDAFTTKAFSGNPACVCITNKPLDVQFMQNIAMEMNLSETAFLVPNNSGYSLRWFTPACEVKLCGHATLASAHVLFSEGFVNPDTVIRFDTLSGELTAVMTDKGIELDFPKKSIDVVDENPMLMHALGATAINIGRNEFDYLVELSSESEIRTLAPDMNQLKQLDIRGVIVTAAASSDNKYDFISRFFAPRVGVDEDPVTGSAHCALAPYWEKKLNKTNLLAYQASKRGGELHLVVDNDRVKLIGKAKTVMISQWLD